jgi:hypothetical protein
MFELKEFESKESESKETESFEQSETLQDGVVQARVLPPAREIGQGEYGSGRYASRQYDQDQAEPNEGAPLSVPLDAQDPKEAIAALRRMLAERDHALLRTALVNSDLKQELDDTKTTALELKQQLTTVVKTNESLTARAAEQAASTKGAAPTADEVLRMKTQFRRAQKALEKEYSRVKEELVMVKGDAFRAQQQLEIEARARRAEAAQASVKISALQQQMEEVAKASFAEATSRTHTEKKTRLWVAVGSFAGLVMLVVGLWSQFGGSRVQAEQLAPAPPAQRDSAPPASSQQITLPAGLVAAGSSSSAAPASPGGTFGPQPSFQRSLNRLNNVLSGPLGRSPEQVLKEVRQNYAKSGKHVCDFEWNGGQPALLYSGAGGGTLDSSLNLCSAAVEQYVAHK